MLLINMSQIMATDLSQQLAPLVPSNSYTIIVLAVLLNPLITLVVAGVVIIKSNKISNIIAPDNDYLNFDNIKVEDLINVAIKILGFCSILFAIPYIAKILSKLWAFNNYNIKLFDIIYDPKEIDFVSLLLTCLLYVFIGVVLIFNSKSIVNRIHVTDKIE